MSDLIRQKVLKITDEVNQLHPVLHKLFEKMPSIERIDYTHGNNEFGADFALQKTHEILQKPVYIGVIAKVDNIAQDYSSVKRQLEECKIPRPLFSGRERVPYDEVWVVTSGNISNNAKIKINDEFSATNIHFLDKNDLVRLLDKYLPSFLLDVPLEVGDYLTILQQRTRELDTRYSIWPGQDNLYISQEVVEDPPWERRTRKRPQRATRVEVLEELEKSDFILLEGGMGAGKSKLLRRTALELTEVGNFDEFRLVPVSLDFKDLVDEHQTQLDRALSALVPQEVRDALGAEDRFVFLIDAVDEKILTLEEQVEHLHEIERQVGENERFKAIVTSRFLAGSDSEDILSRDIKRLRLRPLAFSKVMEFLTKLVKRLEIHERVLEDLKRSPLFHEIPKTPIAAILLAQVLEEKADDVPSSLPELYSKYLEIALGRWDQGKGLQISKEYDTLRVVLSGLADYMIENELSEVARTEVLQRFENYLSDRNLELDAEDLLTRAVERCEVLVRGRNGNTLTFKHRTFAEFLAAEYAIGRQSFPADERAFSLYWSHVYYFGLGIMRDAPEFLERLQQLNLLKESQRWLRLVQLPEYMLAAYRTPYEVVEKGLELAGNEAAELYRGIVGGLFPDSPFSRFSQMELLGFLQFMMRMGYGYEFFMPGLETAALRIAAEAPNAEATPYAVLFLAVAVEEAGGDGALDKLLEEDFDRLPLDIELLLSDRAKATGAQGKLVKRAARKVRKRTKGNKSLVNYIEKLYDLPISDRREETQALEEGSGTAVANVSAGKKNR